MIKLVVYIGKVVAALALSGLCGLISLYDDPWLKDNIEQLVCTICSEALKEKVSFSVDSIDPLRGIIRGRLVSSSSTKDWSFACPEVTARVSWLSAVKGAGIEMALSFSRPDIVTRYEGGAFAIEKPFYALISMPSSLPLVCTACTSKDASVTIISSKGTLSMSCSSVSNVYPHAVLTRIFCKDGRGVVAHNEELKSLIVQGATGTISLDVPSSDSSSYEVRASFVADCATRSHHYKQCVVGYSCKGGIFSVQWYPECSTACVRAAGMHFVDGALKGNAEVWGSLVTLSDFFPLFSVKGQEGAEIAFKGALSIKDSNEFSYEALGTIKALQYRGALFPLVEMTAVGTQDGAEGTLEWSPFKETTVQGRWSYKSDHNACSGVLELDSAQPLFLGAALQNASCNFLYDKQGLFARYTATGLLQGRSYACKGTLASDLNKASCTGEVDTHSFSAVVDIDSGSCTAFSYVKEGKTLIDLQEKEGIVRGMLDFDSIKELFAACTGYELQGTARVSIEPIVGSSAYALSVLVDDAHIKLPFIYNPLRRCTGTIEYDIDQQMIFINDLKIECSRGTLCSPKITMHVKEKNSLSFIHVPYTVDSLPINWGKDITGSLSGAGAATYRDGRWSLSGSLILDKGMIRGNLLSTHVQTGSEEWAVPAVLENAFFDLHLATRRPISLQTSFFEAQAHSEGTLKGTSKTLQTDGSIELVQGTLFFPYKPLYIAKGKVSFASHHAEGSLIDFVAKNKVKKYELTMQVSGSISDPKISFEASPHLPEASIITLLLTGSEDASFYLAMSHMVMMHIKSILFGTPDRLSDAQKFFKSLMTPLSKVRIVPSLNDQKGLEGAIEVDLTDRLRAKAHNNVHLSDDTQVEVEYALSDEVSVKAVRDQKGSLGGEIEMRWKF